MAPRRTGKGLRIVFCHPDLGLGGAERLIVDAAQELAIRGHTVEVCTSYHDPQRCFEETVAGVFQVTVSGGMGGWPDLVIVDQVSATVPLLRVLLAVPLLFYCHFPDLLLAAPRSKLHRLYRAPLDWLEQASTGAADAVVVNSRYTQGVFAATFRRLHARGLVPEVLYPAVQVPSEAQLAAADASWQRVLPADVVQFTKTHDTVFLSINRFERKKDIGLALRALATLLGSPGERSSASLSPGLVVAGGYDPRLPENVEHLEELRALAASLGIQGSVAFLPSFSNAQRGALLATAAAVLYTPTNEHFGIVPLEAAAAGRAVLACSSGGPLETVVDGETGLLRPPQPQAWAGALGTLCQPSEAERLGKAARRRVASEFSRAAFGQRLDRLARRLVEDRRRSGGRVRQ